MITKRTIRRFPVVQQVNPTNQVTNKWNVSTVCMRDHQKDFFLFSHDLFFSSGGRRQLAVALEHPGPTGAAVRVAAGRAGDSRAAGDAQDAAGPHGEPVDARSSRSHRQVHQAVLAKGRHRHFAHPLLRHRGSPRSLMRHQTRLLVFIG